ncbi:MAG: YihY/virulence factor BrkB family protein [Pseudomonadota bacterium]
MPERLSPILPPRVILCLRFADHMVGEFSRDNLMLVAAGIAFYGLLALFPGISAALALLGLMLDADKVVAELDHLSDVLPAQAEAIILGQVQAVASGNETTLSFGFFFGLILTFYSASKGMQALMDGLNMAHNERETRSFIHRYAVRLGLTFFLIAGLLVGVAAAIILPAVLTFFGVENVPGSWVANLSWPILLILTLFGLRILYLIGPDHSRPQSGIMTWGTVIAAALWVLASLGFSWYVSNFGSYNETFGALGGVIVLLMWLWISGLVILIGAEIDATIEVFQTEAREARAQ